MTDTTTNTPASTTTDTADGLETLMQNIETALSTGGARVFVHVRRCEPGGVRALVAKYPGDQFDPFTIGELHGPGRYEARAQINGKMSGSATFDAAPRPATAAHDPQPVVNARRGGDSGGLGGSEHLHRSTGAPPFDPWQLIGVMMQQQTAIVTAALSNKSEGLGVKDLLTAIPALAPLFQSKSTFEEVQRAISMGAKFAGANAPAPSNDEEGTSWPKLLTEAFRAAPDFATAIKTLADLRRSSTPGATPHAAADTRTAAPPPNSAPSGSAPAPTSGEGLRLAQSPGGSSPPQESSSRKSSADAAGVLAQIIDHLTRAESMGREPADAADYVASMLDDAAVAGVDIWPHIIGAPEDLIIAEVSKQMPEPTDTAKRWAWLRGVVQELRLIDEESKQPTPIAAQEPTA